MSEIFLRLEQELNIPLSTETRKNSEGGVDRHKTWGKIPIENNRGPGPLNSGSLKAHTILDN